MVGSDVDARVRLVPGGQVGVSLGADGAQGAGDEVEDGADFGLAFCGRGELVGLGIWMGRMGGREGLTSGCEKHFYAEVGISYAHEDDVVGFVAFEVIVPEIADELGHLCL
jgi:hypothetical protein